MADVTPNYSLEIQGLELEKAQLTLNMLSQSFRIAQSQDEISRIQNNIDATKVAVGALDDRIAAMKVAVKK